MRERVFGFVVVALLTMCSGSGGATETPAGLALEESSTSVTRTYRAIITSNSEAAVPTEGCPAPCDTQFYAPGDNVSRLFTFGFSDTLEIKFRRVKSPGFFLTIRRRSLTTEEFAARLPEGVFPSGSTCYKYNSSPIGTPCVGYDGFGTLPIKGTDYLGPVTWTLVYFANDSNSNPALGHAKGTSVNYTEDILQSYSTLPVEDDPTMQGNSDGLSSVAAISELLTENDTFCWVSPALNQPFKVGREIEVEFRLFASGGCPNTGTPLRDKDARISVATSSGVPVRLEEGGNRRFHFEKDEGVNEREFETDGLAPGFYFITIRSNKFSPQTRRIELTP